MSIDKAAKTEVRGLAEPPMIRPLLLAAAIVALFAQSCAGGSSRGSEHAGESGAAVTIGVAGVNSAGTASGFGGTTAMAGSGASAATVGQSGTAGDTARGGSAGESMAGSNGGSPTGSSGGASAGATNLGASSGTGQASGGKGGAGGSSGVAKIMAIGDSITRATCWRDLLWQELVQHFSGRFDFVGTLSADYGCGVTGFDADNQGYSSSLITEAVAGITDARSCDPYCPSLKNLTTAFNTTRPTVVLMHWGTNDIWNGKSSSSITAAYSSVIDVARAANPLVTILLAQIIPMNVTSATCSGCSCASCSTAVPSLNTAITAFAASKSSSASPVVVVDQYSGFDATIDTRDGVHPNSSGSQKIAARWYQALTANQLVQ